MAQEKIRVVWSDQALKKVDEIANYIEQRNPSAAKECVRKIVLSTRRLELFPYSGRIVPDADSPDLREIITSSYRVYYQVRSYQVYVVTVRHGRQLFSLEKIS